jgi:surface polysaccharide O-acyltransferase-like enzyme
MVIAIHVGLPLFDRFSESWLPIVFYDSLSHACIPIFFMITGFLLLHKEETILDFYKKRMARIIVPLIFYSLIYLHQKRIPVSDYLSCIWEGPVEYHLWYVYNLIGIYLFLPFFKKIFLGSNLFEKIIYACLWFLLNVLCQSLHDYFHTKIGFIVMFNFPMFIGYMGYVFLGGMLRGFPCRKTSPWLIFFLVCSAASMYSTYTFSFKNGKPEATFMSPSSLFVFFATISLFFSLKDLKILNYRLIRCISGCTYGIYLIHILVLTILSKYNLSVSTGSAWITVPVITVICFLLSFCFVFLLKKIKWISIVAG